MCKNELFVIFFVKITKNNVPNNNKSKSQFPKIWTCALIENTDRKGRGLTKVSGRNKVSRII